jgi:hypothetical protein
MSKAAPAELAKAFGIVEVEGSWLGDHDGLARLVRKSVFRRGAATRQEVWNDWRVGFEALGEEKDQIKKTILELADRLATVGDLVSVKIGREHGWVKAKPRWIKLSESQGVALGSVSPMVESKLIRPADGSPQNIVRRFSLRDEATEELYIEAEQVKLSDWLGAGAWREFDDARTSDIGSVGDFWDAQQVRLEQSQFGTDSEDKHTFLLSGEDSYFGKLRSEEPSGRWKPVTDTAPGLWVGRRRGFNENDWRYFFCEVESNSIKRVLPLKNLDELVWTLIAKGFATGNEEKWSLEGNLLGFSFPPPKQLSRLCDLLGWRDGAWKWRLADPSTSHLIKFWDTTVA